MKDNWCEHIKLHNDSGDIDYWLEVPRRILQPRFKVPSNWTCCPICKAPVPEDREVKT